MGGYGWAVRELVSGRLDARTANAIVGALGGLVAAIERRPAPFLAPDTDVDAMSDEEALDELLRLADMARRVEANRKRPQSTAGNGSRS